METVRIYAIDSKLYLKILHNILEVMKANEKYLTKLDADIGDADHGVNMVRGFSRVLELINSQKNPEALDIGSLLNLTGMGILQVVGGAAGPLYGMFFLEASKTVKGMKELSPKDFAKLLEAGLKAIIVVGGNTKPGDKTMVDVLYYVVEKSKEILNSKPNIDFIEYFSEIVPLARESAIKTIPMMARKGRASYLGERSIGHQDPGATSMYLLIRTFLDTMLGRVGVKISKYEESSGKIIEEEYIT